MKTIIIYDQHGAAPIEFYIYDGDCTALDGHYINDADDEAKDEKLLSIVSNNVKHPAFPLNFVTSDDKVIVAGFLP